MIKEHRLTHLLIAIFLVLACILVCTSYSFATSAPNATAKVNAKSGAYLRSKPDTSSSKVTILKNNTNIVIKKEVFIKKNKTDKKNKWYYVTANEKSGYIRSDLVDTIKYATVSGKTTDAVNYRIGASTSMSKKGTFKKDTSVSVVLSANLKGNDTIWYKIKKGTSYYYVCSTWVILDGNNTTKTEEDANTNDNEKTNENEKNVVETKPGTQTNIETKFGTSNLTYPKSVSFGCPFVLKGTIACNKTIETIKIGILDSTGKWRNVNTLKVDNNSFDISKIDAYIKFGILEVGNYTYKAEAVVEGKTYTVFTYNFAITKVSGPTAITKSAQNLAYPVGTPSTKYSYAHEKLDKVTQYDSDRPTDNMKKALDKYYPEHWTSWGSTKYGYGTRTGASCDVFVGTVVRASGYDAKFPRGFDKQWTYLPSSTKWIQINYTFKESDLKSGDIILYKKTTGGVHSCMYIVVNGKGYICEAALNSTYGHFNSSVSKVTNTTNKTAIVVYRANA